MIRLRVGLFGKSFLLFFILSLAIFVFTDIGLITFLKMIAGGILLSLLIAIIYPEVRGVKSGDTVMVISSDSPTTILGRFGIALNNGKKNSTIKIRLSGGDEIVGVIESYEGLITPPRVKVLYEERLVEKWKY